MVACRRLGALRGIPEETLKEIDKMHEQNEKLIVQMIKTNAPNAQAYELLTAADYDLQIRWGFPQNANFHTLVRNYRFRKQWYNRKFKCLETEEEFVIPIDVRECDYFEVGNGGVDVGREGAYSRLIGNIVEVEEQVWM